MNWIKLKKFNKICFLSTKLAIHLTSVIVIEAGCYNFQT